MSVLLKILKKARDILVGVFGFIDNTKNKKEVVDKSTYDSNKTTTDNRLTSVETKANNLSNKFLRGTATLSNGGNATMTFPTGVYIENAIVIATDVVFVNGEAEARNGSRGYTVSGDVNIYPRVVVGVTNVTVYMKWDATKLPYESANVTVVLMRTDI